MMATAEPNRYAPRCSAPEAQSLFTDEATVSGRPHTEDGNPKHQKLVGIAVLAAGSAWVIALVALLVALFGR